MSRYPRRGLELSHCRLSGSQMVVVIDHYRMGEPICRLLVLNRLQQRFESTMTSISADTDADMEDTTPSDGARRLLVGIRARTHSTTRKRYTINSKPVGPISRTFGEPVSTLLAAPANTTPGLVACTSLTLRSHCSPPDDITLT
jgi:hypothetical protein